MKLVEPKPFETVIGRAHPVAENLQGVSIELSNWIGGSAAQENELLA